MAPYSYVKYLLVADKPRTTGIIEHSHSTGVIERASKLRFVTHVTLVTCNTHVFYEIKKPNDFGGLVNILPKATRNLCGCYGGYALLTYGGSVYNARSPEGNAFVTDTVLAHRHTQHRTRTTVHTGF